MTLSSLIDALTTQLRLVSGVESILVGQGAAEASVSRRPTHPEAQAPPLAGRIFLSSDSYYSYKLIQIPVISNHTCTLSFCTHCAVVNVPSTDHR